MSKQMGTMLQETLRCLCYKTGWNYAVFWKLKQGTRMMLAWEDGYCEHAKTLSVSKVSAYMMPSFSLSGMECGQERVYSQDGFSVGDQISLAVAQMSYQVFLVGEGIIGRAAFTGNHQWIFGDKNYSAESNSLGSVHGRAMHDYPNGWQNQFAAGIKTIAVIAVMPYGVVQLGSTQMIMEDLEFVNIVRDVFGIFQNVPKTILPENNQDGLIGKIQGSVLPKMPIQLTSPGNSLPSGATIIASFEAESNKSVLKWPCSNVLDQFKSIANEDAKNKRLPACTLASPSLGSINACAETVNNLCSFQKIPLNRFLSHIADSKGTHIETSRISPSSSKVIPFEGQIPSNISVPDSQQTLITGSSNTFMEKLLIQGKMTSDFQEDCIWNSVCDSAESVDVEKFCQDNASVTEKNDILLGTAVDAHPLPSLFQNSVGQCGYPSIAARLLACKINKTEMKKTSVPVLKVDSENMSYSSSLSSANIGMSISSPRQSSDTQWSVPAGHSSSRMREKSNGLATSLGYDEILVSNIHGTGQPSWPKEIIVKDMPGILQDNGIHSVNRAKESSKTIITDLGKFPDILAGFDNPGLDYHSELDIPKNSDASVVTATEGWFLSETNSEDLLDAVVGSRCLHTNQGGDTFSSTTNSTLYYPPVKSDNISAGQLRAAEKTESKLLDVLTSKDNPEPGNCGNPSFPSLFRDDVGPKLSPNESSTNAQPKYLLNKTHCEGQGLAQVKRPGEPIKPNRKRARPGESPRPRPKDRQQIQDRLKELREIIPNGTKGSIDTLLERTIKHMRFLQSVTKYADKLKLASKSKVLGEENPLLTKNAEGGASWAFELGNKTVGCPVIVENLSQPRQMLVEMLCEERGLFLEIAEIIRNLGLTILKGIMESRSEKIWAHFVVEANKDVHRVEILWSLMQLLQPSSKCSSTITNQSSLVKSQGMDNVSETFDTFQLSPISALLNGVPSGS